MSGASRVQVVRTASHYFLHPSRIDPRGNAGWMRDQVRLWIPGHRKAIERLGSKSWMVEWTKASSKHLDQMMRRARALMGKAP